MTADAADQRLLRPLLVLLAGAALAFLHGRLTRALKTAAAKRQLEADLRQMTALHARLERVVSECRMFSALIENSPDFIGIADASGKPLYLNPAGRRMVGLSADHPLEDTQISDYYPAEQRAFAKDVIVKAMVENGKWQGETFFRHWQTEKAIPVSDIHFMIREPETNRVVGMATITRDISDLREVQDALQRTNQALAEARAFLENVLESSTQYSIIAKDLERRILSWNRGAARNYGYEAAEVIGRSSDMLHVDEELRSGAVAELHQRALAEGHATGLFHRRRKDGSEFLARVMITRRNDANGKAIGYLIISHDVTAEQRHVREQRFLAEVGEALQASLDYAATVARIARLAVGFMGDACAIDVVDEATRVSRVKVVHADPAMAGLAEALEKILPERNHPLWTVVETRRPILFREVALDLLRSVAKDEEHRRLLEALGISSAMFVPLVARDRLIAVLTIVCCGPTRRYDAEDLRLAEELARRASLALDNAELYDVAQQAVEARDLVMGVVAHDLRNPLGTILVAAQLLEQQNGESERRSSKLLDSIERAATRMDRLIGDLLDVTSVEAGHFAIERARLSTEQVVGEALDAQWAVAASVAVELRLDIEADLPDVWADHDRLLRVFQNLIGNAVKFTAPGGRITLGARARDGEVLFWVADTGCGIAAKDLPHLFERFWQTREARRCGKGLGLPIVKGIVEAHSGRIWADSTEGQGSTFFFSIPTAAVVESGSHSAAPAP